MVALTTLITPVWLKRAYGKEEPDTVAEWRFQFLLNKKLNSQITEPEYIQSLKTHNTGVKLIVNLY